MSSDKDIPKDVASPSFMQKMTMKNFIVLVDYLLSTLMGNKELKMEKYLNFGHYGPILEGFDQDDTIP